MTSLGKIASAAPRDRDLESKIRQYLPTSATVYAFLEAESTMEQAHQMAEAGAHHGTFVLAAQQTQGKGRQGRVWNSPKGGLYCSTILRPSLGTPAASFGEAKRAGVGEGVPQPKAEGRPTPSLKETPQLSLVAGLAVAEAIRELTGLLPSIRWPNDLLIGQRKIAGILVERREAVIVGIGVNVTSRLKELPKEATTLMLQGAECELYQLAGTVHQRVMAWYDEWAESGFVKIREALRPWIGHFGQVVHITAGTEEFEGTASDLDDSGCLLVRLDSGILRPFDMGEVTLLK